MVENLLIALVALLSILVAVLGLGVATLKQTAKRQFAGQATMSEKHSEKIARVRHLAAANRELVSTRDGLRALADYVLTEAAVSARLEQLEMRIANAPDAEKSPRELVEELVESILADDETEHGLTIWDRAKKWLGNNKGKVAEKLFGKVNSLLKGWGGGD